MANIQDTIFKMAMNQFEKELRNPSSPIAIKFKTMLYGDPATGAKGIFDEWTNPANYMPPDEKELEAKRQAEIDRYKRTPKQTALDIGFGTAGTLGKGLGDTLSEGSSIFGDALAAMSKSRNGFGSPFGPLPELIGGAAKVGGKLLGGVASTVGNALTNIGKDLKSNREMEREAELLIRERPNGQFYDARKQLSKGTL